MRFIASLKTLTLAIIAVLAAVQPGWATTVDTFDFTQTGWSVFFPGTGTFPDSTGLLSGSFTGAVEPNGFIEQGDLTAFSAVFTPADPTPFTPLALNQLTLFSFDTAGGASSLDFAGSASDNILSAAARRLPWTPTARTISYSLIRVGRRPSRTLEASLYRPAFRR